MAFRFSVAAWGEYGAPLAYTGSVDWGRPVSTWVAKPQGRTEVQVTS
jgi:hypothetical protein